MAGRPRSLSPPPTSSSSSSSPLRTRTPSLPPPPPLLSFRDQLCITASNALAGNSGAQQWMEKAFYCVEEGVGSDTPPFVSLYIRWEAAWQVVVDLSVDENLRFFVTEHLKTAVLKRWSMWPLEMRLQLQSGSSCALYALASALTPLRQHYSIVLPGLASLIVQMTLNVNEDGERENDTLRLITEALEGGKTMQATQLYVALALLAELAEAEVENGRIEKDEASTGVTVSMMDEVVNLAGAALEEALKAKTDKDQPQSQLELQGAFIVAAADCLSKWNYLQAMRWGQIYALSTLIKQTLEDKKDLLHYQHQAALHQLSLPPPSSSTSTTAASSSSSSGMRLRELEAAALAACSGTQAPRVLQSIVKLIAAMFYHTPLPSSSSSTSSSTTDEEGKSNENDNEEEEKKEKKDKEEKKQISHHREALNNLADALENYTGPTTTEACKTLLRAAISLISTQPVWASQAESRQAKLLDWLLKATNQEDLGWEISRLCMETWLVLHKKVPWGKRGKNLHVGMYKELTGRLVRRACRPTEEGEEEEEEREQWVGFREETLAPVLVACYEVLRAEYAKIVLAFLQPFVQQKGHLTSQEMEAAFFALRVVVRELGKRALLVGQPGCVNVNAEVLMMEAAEKQNLLLGLVVEEGKEKPMGYVTVGQIKMDATASHAVLLDIARLFIHLKSEVPAFTAAPLAVREALVVIKKLRRWIGLQSKKEPTLMPRLASSFLKCLSVPSVRAQAADYLFLLVSEDPKALATPAVLQPLADIVNTAMDRGFVNGARLQPEEAAALVKSLCLAALALETTDMAIAALKFVGTGIISRLHRQVELFVGQSTPLPEVVALAIATDVTAIAAMMEVCASHPALGAKLFRDSWQIVQSLVATPLPRLNEVVADAAFAVLGHCLSFSLHVYNRGLQFGDALLILEGLCTVAQQLSHCCPSGFLLFVSQLAESWGVAVEGKVRQGLELGTETDSNSNNDSNSKPKDQQCIIMARQLLILLGDHGMELVSHATIPQDTGKAFAISAILLDCYVAMSSACPSVLLSLTYFPIAVNMCVNWTENHIDQQLTLHALNFLSAVLELSEGTYCCQQSNKNNNEAEAAAEAQAQASRVWNEKITPARFKVLAPKIETLSVAVVKGIFGRACEPLLDALARLLRLLIFQAGAEVLPLVSHALLSSEQTADVLKLRCSFLKFLQNNGDGVPSSGDFEDKVRQMWDYSNGICHAAVVGNASSSASRSSSPVGSGGGGGGGCVADFVKATLHKMVSSSSFEEP